MNWWLKEQAVSRLWLRVLFLKVMGWLGGKGLRVPFSYLMREKNCVMLCLWEQDSRSVDPGLFVVVICPRRGGLTIYYITLLAPFLPRKVVLP